MLFKWNHANWVSSAPFSGRTSLSSSNTPYLSTARMMRKFPPPKKPMNKASLVTLIKSDRFDENEKWADYLYYFFRSIYKRPVQFTQEDTLPGEGPDCVNRNVSGLEKNNLDNSPPLFKTMSTFV